MNIGIDIDNVISKFDEALEEEFLKHDKELRNTGIINPNKHMTEGMFDWTNEEVWSFYLENIERIAKNLEVKEGAKEYIEKLKEDGHTIVIITGRDNGEYIEPYGMTKKWLREKEIPYDKLIFVNGYKNGKQGKAAKCIENGIDVMIDDSRGICKECFQNNITTLIMDKPCNRELKEITRVHNWKEIYEFITNYKKEKVNVILDTDTYNECDDQFALAYLLKNQDKFNIEAITVAPYSHSDRKETIEETTEKSYKEILKICNWLNFETKNKVFKGSIDYICNGYNENNDAVNKIIEVANKNEKTYILAIGAITNVALAIKKSPEIINKMEVIWLGGNSFLADNNREFNFEQDVQAVRDVFESKVKLTVIPCRNVASNLTTSIYELEHFLEGKSELCDYLCQRFYNDTYHGIQERRVIWDISVIAYMINKSWFETEEVSCPIIKEDTSYELTESRHKITFVNYLDQNKIYNDLFKKLVE